MAEQRARRDLAPRHPRLGGWLPEVDSWLWRVVAAALVALVVVVISAIGQLFGW
jgi:hypothetical protein